MTAPPRNDAILAADDLVVQYGKAEALRGIDVHVAPGEIVGIIGPNGAGKTTFCNVVAGFKGYAEGSVTYRDLEVAEVDTATLTANGLIYCTERRDLFGYMSVEDNLILGAYLDADDAEGRKEFVYEKFPRLAERADQPANTLSGGEQQMLALGRGLMGDPDFLVLDEPTLGLAPVIVEDISDTLVEIAEEVTLLLTEQNVTFVMDHADRVYLLEKGEITREGTPADLEADEYVTEAYIG